MSKWLWVLILSLIFFLRFFPGPDNFLWNTSDFARDAYTMQQMVKEKDLRLLGPRSEVYDEAKQAYLVYTGPLFYYVLALPYHFAKGDPNWPLILNILLHASIPIAMGLLAFDIFKSKRAGLLGLIISAFSYELIEYSRWLLNPAMSLPMLAWGFLFLFKFYKRQKYALPTGIFFGLAIQSEIFLLYYLLLVAIIFIIKKANLKNYLQLAAGLLIGVLPMALAEVKFKFRASISLINYLLTNSGSELTLTQKGQRLIEHLAVTSQHNLFGFDKTLALYFLLSLILTSLWIYKKANKNLKNILKFNYLLLASHLIIFLTNFQNSIYIDMGFGLAILLLFVNINYYLWQNKKFVLSYLLIVIVLISQLFILQKNVLAQTPFGGNFFLKTDTMLFGQRLECVEKIYQLAQGQIFTISVLDTPYGWQAPWGSIFETYANRNNLSLPKWYGFSVNGIPGDDIFETTDKIAKTHFVIKPETSNIDEITKLVFNKNQNNLSKLQKQIICNKIILELRR